MPSSEGPENTETSSLPQLVCASCGKRQKLRGHAGWCEPLLKWVKINLTKELKRTKQREGCHIWDTERSLPKQEMLPEAQSKKSKCISKALGKHEWISKKRAAWFLLYFRKITHPVS